MFRGREPRVAEKHGATVTALVLLALLVSCGLAFSEPHVGVPALVLVVIGVAALIGWVNASDRANDERERQRLGAIAPPIGDAWRPLLPAAGIDPARYAERVRTSIRFEPTTTAVRTRFGGSPSLPTRFEWPRFRGHPLAFVGPIDLAEIEAADLGLPETGLLAVFYDARLEVDGSAANDRGSGVVAYFDGTEPLVEREPPRAAQRWPAETAIPVRVDDLPEPEADRPQEEVETIFSLREYLAGQDRVPSTKLLGHADAIQDPNMELQCALVTGGVSIAKGWSMDDPKVAALAPSAAEWRLLFQLGEATNEMSWGDAGLVYFWIRSEDLRARRFDRVWTIFECH